MAQGSGEAAATTPGMAGERDGDAGRDGHAGPDGNAGGSDRRLLVLGPGFGLPSVSPFSTKAMLLLAMAGLDYEARPADPTKAPKGKLPVLIDGGRTVPDSHFIRRHVETAYGHDFDAGLDARERATAAAFAALLEDRLYWVAISERWLYPENRGSVMTMLTMVPAPVRGLVRRLITRSIRRDARGQGMGRHTREEALALGREAIDALAELIGERPFTMGNEPTGLDATAYPFVIGCRADTFETRLAGFVEARPNLLAYAERMAARFPLPTR